MVHHDGGSPSCLPPGSELHSFQFIQKCLNIDLTLTSCLAEIENKFQYGALATSKNRNRNRNSLNKHFTSKTYGDELVFDQIK